MPAQPYEAEVSKTLTISNSLGLHARAAAKIVSAASRFASQVFLEKDGQRVDAKSVLSLLSLECSRGAKVLVSASGADAALALEAVTQVIEGRFGE